MAARSLHFTGTSRFSMTQHSDSPDNIPLWRSKALRRLRALLVLAAIPTGNATAADATLAPTGTLRAAYIVANVAQARHDPVTGTFTGVAAEITRELGRKANVSVTIM